MWTFKKALSVKWPLLLQLIISVHTVTLQLWWLVERKTNKQTERRDQRVNEKIRWDSDQGERAGSMIRWEEKSPHTAHQFVHMPERRQTSADLPCPPPLGIHDNTVSREVGMTTMGRAKQPQWKAKGEDGTETGWGVRWGCAGEEEIWNNKAGKANVERKDTELSERLLHHHFNSNGLTFAAQALTVV